MQKKLSIVLIILSAIIMNGCAGAGYDIAPTTKQETLSGIKVNFDKFKKQTVIETPKYLIRKGFTDTFPVIVGYKAYIKNKKIVSIEMPMKILGTSASHFNEAVGEDGYKFSFAPISIENGSTLITHNGTLMSSSTTIKKEVFSLYLTLKQLKKMSQKDYDIKVYGKTKEGVFTMPQYITKAFLETLLKFN